MKLSIFGAAAFVALASQRGDAQAMNDLRAGVGAPMVRSAGGVTTVPVTRDSVRLPVITPAQESRVVDNGVSRKSLAIGAAVGAVVGGLAGGLAVNNSKFSKNEAAGLFILIGAGIGGVVGAGLGMAVVAFALP